ncbi:MAG: hypothetical protein NWQ54_05865 [Paraglaciecola sp.]|uniref:hypothetical protein n=1 Tax=Pseudomonadati TaxID=3379134 RepID=UPI00273FB331|nr:hypothetical protein [Paraglaciecola sp.]MDP5029585.1 hypothetical protein [Paraglaciecola sp.]MDP5130389.1 hypothetical protein [Paraglaciecola sp.]
MEHRAFIDYCRAELTKTFENIKQSKANNQHKFRTEGLLQAAKLLNILTPCEISKMIEDEHLSVFGESVQQRQARKSSLAELKEKSPDAYFEIPAIERKS